MSSALALDTSVAVPLVVQTHSAHRAVVDWWGGRPVALAGHAAVETFAVLTRLPGDLRVSPADAARLLEQRFAPTLVLGARAARSLPGVLGRLGIAGGAVYDALVALAALEHRTALATRDARARDTYEKLGIEVIVAD